MEFITVHELSRQFNISSRSVRYRLLRLIDARKFKNGEDYLGSRSHIDNAHSRLTKNGKLKRIARGLYDQWAGI